MDTSTQTTQPKTSLAQIIQYSKANPTTDYAKQAYSLIKSGQFDAQAQKEGIDLSWAGRPSTQTTQSKQEGFLSKLGDFAKGVVRAPATLIARPIQAGAELLGASADQVDSATKNIAGDFVAPVPRSGEDVKKDVGRAAETVALGLNPVAGGALYGAGSSVESGNNLVSTKTALDSVLGAAGGKVLELVGKPLFNVAGKVIGHITPDYLKELVSKGSQAIQDFAAQHDILPEKVSEAVNTTAKNVSEAPTVAANAIKSELGIQPKNVSQKVIQSNIDAVNPDLSGKKLIGAYKDVVTGGRSSQEGGLFKEQSLSPDQRSINVGTRIGSDINLKDGTTIGGVKLTSNPIKNLDILNKSLNDTESKLSTALKGDPEVNFNAQKPVLNSSLEELKTTAPREFSAIKENKSVYDNVIDFAQEKVNAADDSIEGLRDARSAFDMQAQKEYPSAYKNGSIDTKTPAGRAIKSVRDTMNEHLYNTAPNGSEIRALIGREADIFHATDTIAPKAAEGHGESKLTKIKKTVKNHPILSAGAVVGADKVLKSTTGIGL